MVKFKSQYLLNGLENPCENFITFSGPIKLSKKHHLTYQIICETLVPSHRENFYVEKKIKGKLRVAKFKSLYLLNGLENPGENFITFSAPIKLSKKIFGVQKNLGDQP